MGYDLLLDPSKYIYTHARAFSFHPGFELLAGVEIDKKLCFEFKKKYKLPVYESLEKALFEHQPQVIVIAVPTQLHHHLLRQALELSKPKIILCEKPLSYSIDMAIEMIRLCKEKNVDLYVNYMRRSDPAVYEIKKRILSGEIETPLKGVAWYSKGFLHNGSHLFNLLEYWLGSVSEFSILNNGRLISTEDKEPDVKVSFKHGEIVFLAAWEEKYSHYTIEFISPTGRLFYEDGGAKIIWQQAENNVFLQGYNQLSTIIDEIKSGMNFYQLNVVDELAKVIAGKNARLCCADEALSTLKNVKNILNKEYNCV